MVFKKSQISRLTLTVIEVFVLSILLGSYANAKPDYTVGTQLSDKSISEGERFEIKVYIVGGGKCEDNSLTIIAEGFINISDYIVTYSENHEMPKKVNFYDEISTGCSVDENYVMQNVTLNQGYDSPNVLTINLLPPYFSNETIHEAMFSANLTNFHDAEGGDYDIQTIFTCLNDNEWYTFTNTKTYHVKSLYEEWEFFIEVLGLLIAFLIALLTLIFSQEIKSELKVLFVWCWKKIKDSIKKLEKSKKETKEREHKKEEEKAISDEKV